MPTTSFFISIDGRRRQDPTPAGRVETTSKVNDVEAEVILPVIGLALMQVLATPLSSTRLNVGRMKAGRVLEAPRFLFFSSTNLL